MQVIVKGRNTHVTSELKEYAEEKVNRSVRYFDQIIKMEVEMMVEKNPSISDNHLVEITAFTKGSVIRAKEASTDMYASIDGAADKLERQIKKAKGKIYHSSQKRLVGLSHQAAESIEEEAASIEPQIVKTKSFAIKPITLTEAIAEMELLGHDFYVFTNSQNEQVNVVYRRKDGNYGLIEPIQETS